MPNGAPFSTQAVCLGWHWYPYRYSRTCDDKDGAPVKAKPKRKRWQRLLSGCGSPGRCTMSWPIA